MRYSGIGVGVAAATLLGSCTRGRKNVAQAGPRLPAQEAVVPRPRSRPRLAVSSRRAMQTLNETIAEINRDYFSPRYFFNSIQDIAEGQRYLLHLMSAATEFYLEGSANNPWFVNMISPVRKYLGDNPDAHYFFTKIHGKNYYQITGRRAESEYISFTAHTGGHNGDWNGPGLFHINHRDILFNSDGTYEILVGPQRRGAKNWLKTNAKVYYILNRYYYEHTLSALLDTSVHPEVKIEAIDPVPRKPTHMQDKEIAKGILAVANFLRVSTLDMPVPTATNTPIWWSATVNRIGKPVRFGDDQQDIGFGAVDNTYAAGPYRIKRGEALVMDGHLPDCFFANVVLWNRFMQTDNYLHNTISLNRRQMKLVSNDKYRIVVSAEDPRTDNWLNTCGRTSGYIHWRWLLAEGAVERPRTRIMPVSAVKSLAKPS